MPAVLIKNVPADLHRRLKQRAEQNRRSMNQETLLLLEKALDETPGRKTDLPQPIKTRRLLTDSWLKRAVRSGRA